jgi:kynureninase
VPRAGTGSGDHDALRLDRSYAEELDAEDRLAPYRERFVLPEGPHGGSVVYLCGNSLGLMPKRARDLVERELDDWSTLGVQAHFRGRAPWYSYHERFRETGARLVGAIEGEVVMMNSLTVNLHLMMVSFYRPEGRRTKILMEDHAFPSDRYAATSQVALHGLDPAETIVIACPRAGETALRTDDIVELLKARGDEIALVLLGGVNYFTGQRFEMDRIVEAARREGCLVGLDLAHAVGNVPLDLHDWEVDFAVWCSYKYLNGGPGAVAGCFVHERHAKAGEVLRLAGWWGNDPATRFRMSSDFEPAVGADGWQLSNPPILAMAPLEASLELFDEVGMSALRAKSVRMTGYVEGLLRSLESEGLEIVTPSDPGARGCQLSVRVLGGLEATLDDLTERGIVVDSREPDIIRVAPVPFYNTFEDVWVFASALGEIMGSAVLRRS